MKLYIIVLCKGVAQPPHIVNSEEQNFKTSTAADGFCGDCHKKLNHTGGQITPNSKGKSFIKWQTDNQLKLLDFPEPQTGAIKYNWKCSSGHVFVDNRDNVFTRVETGGNRCMICPIEQKGKVFGLSLIPQDKYIGSAGSKRELRCDFCHQIVTTSGVMLIPPRKKYSGPPRVGKSQAHNCPLAPPPKS